MASGRHDDDPLRAAIEGLTPGARDKLRRVLVMDPADRDEVVKDCSGSATRPATPSLT